MMLNPMPTPSSNPTAMMTKRIVTKCGKPYSEQTQLRKKGNQLFSHLHHLFVLISCKLIHHWDHQHHPHHHLFIIICVLFSVVGTAAKTFNNFAAKHLNLFSNMYLSCWGGWLLQGILLETSCAEWEPREIVNAENWDSETQYEKMQRCWIATRRHPRNEVLEICMTNVNKRCERVKSPVKTLVNSCRSGWKLSKSY